MRIETKVLQAAQTTGNGTAIAIPHCSGAVVYAVSSAGVSAGTVVVEEDMDGTATTWAAIGSPLAFTTANTTLAVHLDGRVYGNIRARFSVNVTGGTVTVTCIARATQY